MCSAPWYINTRLISFIWETSAMYPTSTPIFATPSIRDFSHAQSRLSTSNWNKAKMPVVMAVGSTTNNPSASATPNNVDIAINPPILSLEVSISSSTINSADLEMIFVPSIMDTTRFMIPRKNGIFLYQGFFVVRRVVSVRI